ncbi:MAG TPA: ACT domain-containing protein [Verrucomicrobiae bacterium]|nr:ACT domain-containing protein [Verrucomicrobiae bacterium]
MAFKVQRVETWAAPLQDKPGGLAAKLAALAHANVNLEFLIARRAPDRPGKGVVFVTPIEGAAKVRAARAAGFRKTVSLHTVRFQGPDRKGVGAKVTRALAEQGLNVRGLSAAAMKGKFIAHLALDTTADAAKAMRILRAL